MSTDVRDSSLKLPSGSTGVVIDVRVFNRHGIEKDERSIAIERAEIELVQEDKKVEEEILNRNIKLRAIDLLNNQVINKQYKTLKAETTLNKNDFEDLTLKDLQKYKVVLPTFSFDDAGLPWDDSDDGSFNNSTLYHLLF